MSRRTERMSIAMDGRGMVVPWHEAESHLRARRVVAHPMAEVLRCDVGRDEARGPFGSTVVSLTVELGDEHLPDVDRGVGDAGGARDRAIAYAARELTKQGDPQAVIEALLRHYVACPEDLGRALRHDPGSVISTELRDRIARSFGLVEPALPKWVVEGALVKCDAWGREEHATVARVDAHGVSFVGENAPLPAGVFLVMGWGPA
jgi:hypothetical protein